ncbi:hypothetical protein [Flavobacterium sp. H4147]|uniref:hypothetical protein n=1 Tax=Flavobacterium sp. H4147 TaxID=3034149 RepID=UPI0023EAE27B|nr:hypothetical protein [Flavobacterium sp. H4147]
MKNQTLRISVLVLLISLLNYSCAPHCDDEDYRKDPPQANIYKVDSLKVSDLD